MTVYFLALWIGGVAGLRAMMAPAAISWAAALGWLSLAETPLAFLGYAYTPYIFTALALAELISDQLPRTPSRKVPVQFATRLVSGALCGAALGFAGGSWIGGALGGLIGALVGTLGGASARAQLAQRFGRDLPAALIEDAIALAGAVLVVMAVR
jgi:uncharacterized membrane protein